MGVQEGKNKEYTRRRTHSSIQWLNSQSPKYRNCSKRLYSRHTISPDFLQSNLDLFADLDLVEVSFPPPPPPTPDTVSSMPSEKPFVDESVTADLLGMLLQAYQPSMQQQQHQEQQHSAPVATV